MFSFQVGNTTVHLLPILVWVAVVLIVLVVSAFSKKRQIDSMAKLCQNGEYEKSILLANKLLVSFTRSYKLYRGKNVGLNIERFHIWLAISYLGLSNYDLFWEHINQVEQQKNIADTWIAAYYILQKDLEQMKHYGEKIEATDQTENTRTLLLGVILCEEGKTNEGKEILSALLPKINFALTKQIVLSYIA